MTDTSFRVVRHSPATFRARAEPWLLENEAEHNLLLGLAARLEESTAGYEPPIYLATIERGEGGERGDRDERGERAGDIVGCAFRTPPFNLGITRLPAAAVEELAADVAQVYDSLRGVLGPAAEARALAARWSELKGAAVREHMRERIYVLERVIPPGRAAPGRARTASEADAGLVVSWVEAFAAEADAPANMEQIRRLVKRGRILLWDDDGARSMAATGADTPHGSRVGPVYTPPLWRGRGYATACVAELSRRILAGGRRFCFLYTDLSNPTSNAIYQRIGYEPVSDVVDYRFEPATGIA